MKRQLATALVFGLLGAGVLTPILSWINPCIGVTRFEPCEEYGSTSDELVVQPCQLFACDWFPSVGEQALRVAVMVDLMLMIGLMAGMAGVSRSFRTAALSGALCVLFTFLLSSFVYPYMPITIADVAGSAIPIGAGALISLFGAWLSSKMWPNKTIEPTR